jgi:hypothetical protein
MTNSTRLALLGAAIAVAIAAFVIASGSNDDDNPTATTTKTTKTATPATTTTSGQSTGTETSTSPAEPHATVAKIVVRNAKPVGGVRKITAKKGDQLVIVVQSDTADEIHIHGYDLHKDVEAGGSVRFEFTAKIDGGFEIELEDRKQQIAELTVKP